MDICEGLIHLVGSSFAFWGSLHPRRLLGGILRLGTPVDPDPWATIEESDENGICEGNIARNNTSLFDLVTNHIVVVVVVVVDDVVVVADDVVIVAFPMMPGI